MTLTGLGGIVRAGFFAALNGALRVRECRSRRRRSRKRPIVSSFWQSRRPIVVFVHYADFKTTGEYDSRGKWKFEADVRLNGSWKRCKLLINVAGSTILREDIEELNSYVVDGR